MLDLAAGDVNAAATLVARYRRRLLGYLTRLLCDPHRAEDAFQETFVRLHGARRTFKPVGRFAAFLFTIATHVAYRELERDGKRSLAFLDAPIDSRRPDVSLLDRVASLAAGPEEMALRADLRSSVEAGLATLPTEYRSALVLREMEELSYEEIAAALEVPVGTVRSRVHRGRQLLAGYLAGRGVTSGETSR